MDDLVVYEDDVNGICIATSLIATGKWIILNVLNIIETYNFI